MLRSVGALVLCLGVTYAIRIEVADISLLSPRGIRFAVKDVPGVSLVALHYSINRGLPGVKPGQWNYDVRTKTGNLWIHENRNVNVNPGDRVNYWVYAVHNGLGHQLLEQSWTASGDNIKQTPRPTPRPTTPGRPVSGNLRLVMDDNFSTFNLRNWRHEVTASGGGNWEFQVYTPETRNVYVRDNTLFIKPTLTADRFGENFVRHGIMDVNQIWGKCTDGQWWGCRREGRDGNVVNPIMSGKIRSNISFRYGRMEVVAKMPKGDWIWPAIWLMPEGSTYGGWPRSGEIDVCESRGNLNYGRIGVQEAGATLHWGTPGNDRYTMTAGTKHMAGNSYGDKFVKYTLDWDEMGIRVYFDDALVLNTRTPNQGYFRWGNLPGNNVWAKGGRDAPFDKPFYVILNVAVGGTNGYFPDGVRNYPQVKPWRNNSPKAAREFWDKKNDWYQTWRGEDAAMQIKSVKIWERV